MDNLGKALWYATVSAAVALVVGLIPGLQILVLIAVQIPLWILSDAGIAGLGEGREGFFIPTSSGWMVALLVFWLSCCLFFLLMLWLGARLSGALTPKQPQ